jgi:hypothetical protein
MTTSEIATLAGYEQFAPWLLVEKRGNVHLVSINRPEALNAVTEEVHHAFATIWKALDADDDVRAVVTKLSPRSALRSTAASLGWRRWEPAATS